MQGVLRVVCYNLCNLIKIKLHKLKMISDNADKIIEALVLLFILVCVILVSNKAVAKKP